MSAGLTRLERILEVGRAAYPGLAIERETIAPWIAQRLDTDESPDAVAADEVYLAAACAAGSGEAMTTFERRYFGMIVPTLSRMSLGADAVAEVEQVLRIRLFVASPGALPHVLEYAGDGQLAALVRVATVRAGLNLLRQTRRLEHDADGLEQLPTAADDPERAQLKAEHRSAFKAVFESVIATLAPRDRTLLRLSFVDKVGVDGVGRLYGVHRATAARWIASARDQLARGVHRALGQRLGVRDRGDVDQLLPLVESQLELSLERLLQSTAPAGAAGAG